MKVPTFKAQFPRWLPKTPLGRFLLGAGMVLMIFISAAAFVIMAVWIENRFPGDQSNRSWIAGLQKAVTKPIVGAVSRTVETHIRNRMEARYMNTGLSLEDTIARFLDETVPMEERRLYAYRLARAGTPEAVAALVKVFRSAQSDHRAFMAQLIGSTGNPAAKEWLWPLLSDSDDRVVMAVIRGLSAIGGKEVSDKLGTLLRDPVLSEQIRIEAAMGLGAMGTPEAAQILARSFEKTEGTELELQILDALGHFPFETVASTFERCFYEPDVPAETRVAAAEAMAYSSPAAVPFLLSIAQDDADPEVRASAAWAVSIHGRHADIAPLLTDMVEREPEADVRRRLYEALLPQADIPAERLLTSVMAEDDLAARVAGFNVLAAAAGQGSSITFPSLFDRQIVPELLRIATSDTSTNLRMRAVFALRRAQTAPAQSALFVIANSGTPEAAETARHGLQPRK